MKKFKTNLILIAILAIALLIIFSGNVNAAESEEKITEDGFKYTIYIDPATNADGSQDHAVITGLKEGIVYKTLTIPETIEGYKVSYIEEKAFENNTDIEKVIFPKNRLGVGSYAFSGCTNLKEVEVNSANIDFSYFVFKGSLIETLNFPKTTTECGLDSVSFAGMEHLKTIYFDILDGVWIWDHETAEEEFNNYVDFFRNNVTIYGHKCTYEEDDATNAAMLSAKAFSTVRGIKFIDLDTSETNYLEDKVSNITVFVTRSKTAKLTTTKLDVNSEDYKEMVSQVPDSDIALAYDISVDAKDYSGDITVVLPVDSKYNGKTALVLHKKADGTIEKLTSVANNGSVIVKVTELSPFVVSFASEAADEEDSNPSTDETENPTETEDTSSTEKGELDNTPKTGVKDFMPVVLITLILSAMGIVTIKKK